MKPNKENSRHIGNKVDRRKLRNRAPSLAEVLPVEAGGKAYDFVFEPRCRVCNSGDGILELVNRLLATGMTYRDVERAIEVFNQGRPLNRRITYNSIRTHQKNHMPFEAQAVRDILERRAAEASRDFIDGVGSIVTPVSYAEAVMQRSFETLIDNNLPVDTKDGLAAAKLVHTIDAGLTTGMDEAEAMAQLNRIIEAVRAVVTPEQMVRIGALLESSRDDDQRELEVLEVDADEVYDPVVDDED